jgi:N-methylhydantoinase A
VADTVAHESAREVLPSRTVYFSGVGEVYAAILRLEAMSPGTQIAGPAIVESSFTTVVLNPGAIAERSASGSLVITPEGGELAGSAARSSEAVS